MATPTGTRVIGGSHVARAVAAGGGRAGPPVGLPAAAGGAAPAAVGVGAPGMVDRRGRLCFAPNLPQAQGVDWNELIGDELPGPRGADRERRQLRRAGRAPAGGRPRVRRRRDGDPGDGHRRAASCSTGACRSGRPASPARSATWWWTRPARPAPAGGGAAGSASPRAPASACWPGRPPWRGGSTRWCASPAATPRRVRGEDVSAAAAAGDPAAPAVIQEVGGWIGFGLANLAAVLDPACFVLGGGRGAAPATSWSSRPGPPSPSWSRAATGGPGGDRAGRVRRAGRGRRRRAGGAPGRPRRPGLMRTGVVLPTFRDTPEPAFAAAAEAAAAGVDGVFCYDHIWPIGQPERPALAPFPILGARGRHARPAPAPSSGTLVARIGLVPNAVLAAQFLALGDPGPRAGDRRAGHRRPPERGGEPRLRHPLRSAGAAPGRHGGAGAASWSGRASRSGSAGGPAGRTEEARAAGAALTVWDAAAGAGGRASARAPTASRSPGPARRPRPRRRSPRRLRALARGRAPRGRSSAGPSTSRRWWPRPRALGDGPRSGARGTRVLDFHDGVPPHQRAAALRLRHHQRPEGGGAASRA